MEELNKYMQQDEVFKLQVYQDVSSGLEEIRNEFQEFSGKDNKIMSVDEIEQAKLQIAHDKAELKKDLEYWKQDDEKDK